MFAVRIHGRGGQGVVTAAELLALAAFLEERHAQAFPSFGSERTGAPVVSFCRIDDRPIRVREPIVAPDALIIQDPTLLHQVDVFGGMRAGGAVLINTGRAVAELGLADLDFNVLAVPASELAREHVGRPLPNAALLGGFAALCGIVSLESVTTAIARALPAARSPRGTSRPRSRRTPSWRERGMPLKQMEGSRAVAETVALCRPEVIPAYPISPQTHIVEALSGLVRTGELAPCEYVNVESEFAAMSVAIGASATGARTYTATASQGLLFMVEALYNASGPRPADRHDGRQPRDRRADQHLERPLGLDVAARLGLDPALRGDQPGGRRPARPGLPARRAALAPGHGLHGRLHPHARVRARGAADAGAGRRVPPGLRAAPDPRPG